MKTIHLFAISLLFLLFFASCRSATPLVESTTQSKKERDHRSTEKDSVYIYEKDSVFIFQKGDTVFFSKMRTQYRDRFRDRTDTLRITDTLLQKAKVTKLVKAPLNGWQNFQIWAGRIVLILLLLYIAGKAMKRYLKPI